MNRRTRATSLLLAVGVCVLLVRHLTLCVGSVAQVRRELARAWGYPAPALTWSDVDIALGVGHEYRAAPVAGGRAAARFSSIDVTIVGRGRRPPQVIELLLGRDSAPVVSARAAADDRGEPERFAVGLVTRAFGLAPRQVRLLGRRARRHHVEVDVRIDKPPPHLDSQYRVDLFPPEGIYFIERSP